ncbi:MAG: hypothetical protein ACRC2K_06455 [Clostridium sp.]
MRYIGPFFRMNSLSQSEISNQLFFLSKEAIKTLVLNSKCGIVATNNRGSKKTTSTNDISTLNNFSPLLCIYRKSSPSFIHSKSSHGFDESTFKKEINASTNALMTLSLLELSDYYNNYNNVNADSYRDGYIALAKEQLDFYYENLRNNDGVFVSKKNITEGSSRNFALVEKERKFNFVDQAFMMTAYYLYSLHGKDEEVSKEYKAFSLEILQMFSDFKDSLYNLSLEELCKLLLSFNVFYRSSSNSDCLALIIDLGDFAINKFNERDYYVDDIEYSALLSICLLESYKHTNIISFKEKHDEILEKLLSLYDEDKGIFNKLKDKKDIKYSCLDINFYILALIMHCNDGEKDSELRGRVSTLYRRLITSSGIIPSWPEAPSIDEKGRYRDFSLKADDLLDETYFKMSNIPTPQSSGLAPIFIKNVSYSRKKDTFEPGKNTFDSSTNMLIFFTFIYYLKDDVCETMFPSSKLTDLENDDSIPRVDDSDIEIIE